MNNGNCINGHEDDIIFSYIEKRHLCISCEVDDAMHTKEFWKNEDLKSLNTMDLLFILKYKNYINRDLYNTFMKQEHIQRALVYNNECA